MTEKLYWKDAYKKEFSARWTVDSIKGIYIYVYIYIHM